MSVNGISLERACKYSRPLNLEDPQPKTAHLALANPGNRADGAAHRQRFLDLSPAKNPRSTVCLAAFSIVARICRIKKSLNYLSS